MTNPTLSAKTTEILVALRASVEGKTWADEKLWGWVYLDNARVPGTSRHAFAGHLSALEAVGLYLNTGDKNWGKVLLP